jgi:hypothetical protein
LVTIFQGSARTGFLALGSNGIITLGRRDGKYCTRPGLTMNPYFIRKRMYPVKAYQFLIHPEVVGDSRCLNPD